MAVQNLVEQHVIFISNSGESVDSSVILANSQVQSLAANSAGNDLIVTTDQYAHWTGTAWQWNAFLHIHCYITSAFQATVQADIPSLQAALPQYTIVTWGYPTSFGN